MATQQVNERLAAVTAAGTSIWLDQIKRALISTGELERLVEEDSLRGVTSNPTIFNQAILGSEDYDEQLAELARAGKHNREIYQELARSIPISPSTPGARSSRRASTPIASTVPT
jgi:hypothetical protein